RVASYKRKLQEKIEEMRAGLAMTLPHEFLTARNIILGFTEVILDEQEELVSDELVSMVRKIRLAGVRLQKLIQNFLLHAELKTLVNDPERLKLLQGKVDSAGPLIAQAAEE